MNKIVKNYLMILTISLNLMLVNNLSYSQITSTPYLIQLNKVDTGYILSLIDVKKINYTFGQYNLTKSDLKFAIDKINDLHSYISIQDTRTLTLLNSINTYKGIISNQDTIINTQQLQISSLKSNNKYAIIKWSGCAFVAGVIIMLIFH